jgi:hypothetical protein
MEANAVVFVNDPRIIMNLEEEIKVQFNMSSWQILFLLLIIL